MKFIEFSDKLVNLDKVNFVQLTELDGTDELTFCFSDGCKLKSSGIKTDMYDGGSAESVTYAYLKDILLETKSDEKESEQTEISRYALDGSFFYDEENEVPPSEEPSEEELAPCDSLPEPQKWLSNRGCAFQKLASLKWKPMAFFIALFVLVFSFLCNITKLSKHTSQSDDVEYLERDEREFTPVPLNDNEEEE